MRWLPALFCVLAGLHSAAATGAEYKGVTFILPARWTSAEQDGTLLLAPPGSDDRDTVIVALFGAGQLGGTALRDWFEQQMAAGLHAQARVLNQGEVRSIIRNNLTLLTTVRAVRDAEGATRIQMFNAASDGRQAGLAMVVAASEQAIERHADAIRAFFESMRVGTAPAPAPPGMSAAAPAPHALAQAALPAGNYHCLTTRWSPNQPIVYEPSILGRLVLDGRGTYQVAATGNSGSYRVSGSSFVFTSGPLSGWPALAEMIENHPRIRLGRTKETAPNPAGASFGEHRCTLRD